MDLSNLNILNVFKKKTFNEKSIALLIITLLPAMFVTQSIEATLVYILLYVIFIILATLANKLVDLISDHKSRWILLTLTYVVIATLISQFVSALNVDFTKDFILYVYLFPIGALPYLLKEDNKDKSIGHGLVDALQSVLILIPILLVTALIREFFGTGGISFGKYIGLDFGFSLFPNYAIAVLKEPYSVLIILGLYIALLQFVLNSKNKEETK